MRKTPADLTQDLNDASDPSVDQSTVHQNIIRNALRGRVAVMKPFLWKANMEKRKEKYAIFLKKWKEKQQRLLSDKCEV